MQAGHAIPGVVYLGRDWLLHEDARQFLPAVRPAFLGLQCGMAIGLANTTRPDRSTA